MNRLNHLLSFTRIIGVGRVLLSHYCADYCFASLTAKNIVVVALSVILLGMLLMMTRKNAITHIIGFMVMENGLFLQHLCQHKACRWS